MQETDLMSEEDAVQFRAEFSALWSTWVELKKRFDSVPVDNGEPKITLSVLSEFLPGATSVASQLLMQMRIMDRLAATPPDKPPRGERETSFKDPHFV